MVILGPASDQQQHADSISKVVMEATWVLACIVTFHFIVAPIAKSAIQQ
jgi:hypothetical protein